MIKISDREIIDIINYNDNKMIIVEKRPLGELNKYKANFYALNFNNGSKEPLTKNAYLLKKFGNQFEKITDTITNYVQCDSIAFPSKNIFVIFPNGQTGLFNEFGEMRWSGVLKYNEHNCSSAAEDGEYFWTCCPDENCVIRYTADSIKLDLRIGSKDAPTFSKPIFASADDKFIYICNEDGRIRKISKSNFAVSDFNGTYPGLKRFYKHGRFSIICTSKGAYIEKDD